MSSLPEGWQEAVDPQHDRLYYFHARTRRSTWTRPSLEALTSSPPENGYVRFDRAAERAKEREGSKLRMEQTVQRREAEQGWIEAYSNEHRRAYFFNRKTGERRWTLPQEAAQDDSECDKHGDKGPWYTDTRVLPMANRDIDRSREDMAKERDHHVLQLRSEWLRMREEIARIRNLDETMARENPQTEPALEETPAAPQREEYVRPREHAPSKHRRGPSDLMIGLLSELEEFTDSLMVRQEGIIALGEGEGSTTDRPSSPFLTRPRRESMLAREESQRLLLRARKARRSHGHDSGSEDDDESSSGWLGRASTSSVVVKGRHSNLSQENRRESLESDALMDSHVDLEDEIKEVNTGFRTVNSESEALHRAQIEADDFSVACYYTVLNVSPTATVMELRKAYQRLQRLYHPDKWHGKDADKGKKLSAELSEAYTVLEDPWTRFLYDEMGLREYKVYCSTVFNFLSRLVHPGFTVVLHPLQRSSGALKKLIDQQLVKRFSGKSVLWLSVDHKYLNIASHHILEPSEKDLPKIKRIDLADITDIVKGMQTESLSHNGLSQRSSRYFSILTRERSYDIDALDAKEREYTVSRLILIVIHLTKNKAWFNAFTKQERDRRKYTR